MTGRPVIIDRPRAFSESLLNARSFADRIINVSLKVPGPEEQETLKSLANLTIEIDALHAIARSKPEFDTEYPSAKGQRCIQGTSMNRDLTSEKTIDYSLIKLLDYLHALTQLQYISKEEYVERSLAPLTHLEKHEKDTTFDDLRERLQAYYDKMKPQFDEVFSKIRNESQQLYKALIETVKDILHESTNLSEKIRETLEMGIENVFDKPDKQAEHTRLVNIQTTLFHAEV